MTTGHGSLKAPGFIREIAKERNRRCRRGARRQEDDDYSARGCFVLEREDDSDGHGRTHSHRNAD